MSYVLLDNPQTVQVQGPQLALQAMLCTIQSFPSGSFLIRTVPMADFQADQGQGLLASLSDATEQELEAGVAISAEGVQGIDANNLIYDAVRFTVGYTPPGGATNAVTAPVDVPVNVLTADTSFGGFLSGGSAAERIQDAYQKLVAMSTG